MFKRFILTLVALTLSQSMDAIIIINQTDTKKVIEIEEAYRPPADKPGNLASPISLGYLSESLEISPHSMLSIPLITNPALLLVTLINKEKKGSTTTTTRETTCFEPYGLQDQKEEKFNDGWAFVIHKPIVGKTLPFQNSNYYELERMKRQGYGIKCLHPLLVEKVASLDELPEDLKLDFSGSAPLSIRRN